MYKSFPSQVLAIALAVTSCYATADEPYSDSAPSSAGVIYSNIKLKTDLALEQDAEACVGEQCVLNDEFDARVKMLGEQMVSIAYNTYPNLQKRIPQFVFSVANKKNIATASNAEGAIVLFRGFQGLELSDDALSFLLAREMGHVIANHHDKNTKTKIMFTVLASVLFPAVALVSATNAAAQASTATSVVTSLASSATSYVGSEAAMSNVRPAQLAEADKVATTLTKAKGVDMLSVASELNLQEEADSGWLKDLDKTANYLYSYAEKELEAGVPATLVAAP